MRLYFAGSENDAGWLRDQGVQRALVAFSAQRKNVIKVMRAFDDVLLDSGAFAAFNSGAEITMSDYIGFVRNSGAKRYIQLDVIGDHEATRVNLERMRHAGLDPIPVYHLNEPLAVLERLFEEVDYVCIGGAARRDMTAPKLRELFDTVFAVARDSGWPKRIHGLGVQQRWALERYPFYSVDATTWQNGSRYGSVISSKTHTQISGPRAMGGEALKDRARKNHDFAVYGVTATDARAAHNVRQTIELERHVTHLWERRGIVWDD